MVDTSAVAAALLGRPRSASLVTRLAEDGDLHALHLLDVELLQVLRRLVTLGELSADRAADARADFADLAIVRYPHQPLVDRMWELRDNLTPYDAAFVVLSEVLGVPLVTTDKRLSSAPGHHAEVEVFAAT